MKLQVRFPILTSAIAVSLSLLTLAGSAQAQVKTLLPFHKSGDLLIGDVFNGVVLRARDLTGDGGYGQAGELTTYFDPASAVDPATGLAYSVPLGVPSVITADLFANVYIVSQGPAPRIFKTRDVNGDGDVNDSGESSIYLEGSLVAVLVNASVNGAAFDPNGALWITADAATADYVLKLTDVNLDGDVNDAGEQAIVYNDAASATAGNSPLFNVAWAGFTKTGAFYMTNAASFHKFTVSLTDNSVPPNGVMHDAGDVKVIYSSQSGNPAQGVTKCARFGLDGRLYLYNAEGRYFIAAEDLNGNGVFDNAGEAKKFFVAGDQGAPIESGYVFDIRSDGAVVLCDYGNNPKLVVLKDLTGDGDAQDAGEWTIDLQFVNSAFPTAQPRTVFFMPEEPSTFGTGCLTSTGTTVELRWNPSSGLPIPGNGSFGLTMTGGPANSAVGLLYADSLTAIALDTLAPGAAQPGCMLYTDIFSIDAGTLDPGAFTNSGGAAAIWLPLGAGMASVAGKTYVLQAVALDGGLTLPVVMSNAVTIPIL